MAVRSLALPLAVPIFVLSAMFTPPEAATLHCVERDWLFAQLEAAAGETWHDLSGSGEGNNTTPDDDPAA